MTARPGLAARLRLAADQSPQLAVAVVALLGFVLARALDLGFFSWQAAAHPGSTVATGLTAWDGGWYRRIAGTGYPATVLRHVPTGHVAKSQYAFFPAFPLLVRWVSGLTHLGFTSTAVLLNVELGACAAVGIAAVLQPWLGPVTAATASVFWSFLPTAAVLMMAYSEALFCLEIALFFLLLQHRRYSALAVLLPVIGLTRGLLLPLAAVLGCHLILRTRDAAATGGDRFRAVIGPALLIVLAGACSALWPGYVGWRAGRWNAYLTIEDAWVDDGRTHPGWWHLASYLTGPHTRIAGSGLVVITAVIALLVCLVALRSRLSPELKTFGLAYLLYLFAVTPIWSSFFRYLLPVFTLPAVLALATRSIWTKLAALVVLGVLQYCWIDLFVANYPHSYATP